MKKGIIVACLLPALWICVALFYVNKDMPLRDKPEKFGLEPALALALMFIPIAFLAYQGGKHDQD